jgi:hypothetical protein
MVCYNLLTFVSPSLCLHVSHSIVLSPFVIYTLFPYQFPFNVIKSDEGEMFNNKIKYMRKQRGISQFNLFEYLSVKWPSNVAVLRNCERTKMWVERIQGLPLALYLRKWRQTVQQCNFTWFVLWVKQLVSLTLGEQQGVWGQGVQGNIWT